MVNNCGPNRATFAVGKQRHVARSFNLSASAHQTLWVCLYYNVVQVFRNLTNNSVLILVVIGSVVKSNCDIMQPIYSSCEFYYMALSNLLFRQAVNTYLHCTATLDSLLNRPTSHCDNIKSPHIFIAIFAMLDIKQTRTGVPWMQQWRTFYQLY